MKLKREPLIQFPGTGRLPESDWRHAVREIWTKSPVCYPELTSKQSNAEENNQKNMSINRINVSTVSRRNHPATDLHHCAIPQAKNFAEKSGRLSASPNPREIRYIIMKKTAIITIVFLSHTVLAAVSRAENGAIILFPWHCASSFPSYGHHSAESVTEYRVLSTARRTPQQREQPVATKHRYRYGYFGAQPHTTRGRRFGYSSNFTQWTAR